MNDNLRHFVIFGAGVVLAFITISTWIIPAREREAMARIQRDAIKVGVAVYGADDNGDPLFLWRKECAVVK